MKKLIKRITAFALAVLMMMAMMPGENTKAAGSILTQSGSKLGMIGGVSEVDCEAGKSITVVQMFKLVEPDSVYGIFGVSTSENAPFSIRDVSYKYESNNLDVPFGTAVSVGYANSAGILVSYTIDVEDYASVGTYDYYVDLDAWKNKPVLDADGNEVYNDKGYAVTEKVPVEIGAFRLKLHVTSEKTAPTFKLVSDPYVSANAGDTVSVSFEMKNVGELDAYETYVSLESDNVLVPIDTVMKQRVGLVNAGQTFRATYKFRVSEKAPTGTIVMPITVTAKSLSGSNVPMTEGYKIYLNVTGNEPTPTPAIRESGLIVSKVSHDPEQPKAGEELTVKFKLENNGDEDLSNVKVRMNGASVGPASFEPINSDPYFYIGSIAAHKTKDVSIKIRCGESISEGINNLSLDFEAETKEGSVRASSASLYILNVIGKQDDRASKPKLMVTEFSTDVETVMSGKSFDFRFFVKNTNDETRAKNIKVKVTSSEFSVSSGSNSFFISEIKPGESEELSINLKASAAAATGAYPITVSMEYEYDGMPTGVNYDSSVTASDELLLQINETLRASLENIQVGDWNTPMVGNPTTATFEFYNMGKSSLNNVYVTVEGDFILATGDSYYMGNMQPGMPEYIECNVIPMTEGDATCVFVIHMEDSNGDEVTSRHQTQVYVGNGENIYDPGFDPGFDPGMFPGDTDEGEIIGFDEFGNPIYADPQNNNTGFLGGLFGNLKLVIIIGVSAVAVAAVVIVIVVVNVKKKKKQNDEFED
ncbi:MAG: hypothetical protein MJ124_06840 [Lachnospiraceae bacterium]|nr:hypothetical protein [Lachnospiraceae bacterium]